MTMRDPTPEERRAFSVAEAETDLEIQVEKQRLNAASLAEDMERRRLCALGYHAWTPYLGLPTDAPNRYVTWCAREGCDGAAQYDL